MQNADLIPGLGRSPGEGNDDHSSILAWKIPWTEEPVGCRPWGHKESGKTEHTCMHTCSLYTHFVESFDHNWVSNFVKSSFCICWDGPMTFILQFAEFYLQWCITLIDLQIFNHPCCIGIPTWLWCMIFLMYCWIKIANILLRIFASMFFSDVLCCA